MYEHVLRGRAANYDLGPALLAAVVYVENRLDPNARSEAGALGLMRLLPETRAWVATPPARRRSSARRC
ncbi:MAG TPA: transglycosylase SLT domain-containing protein [Gaiellaceae bacterium]|nr:transglycosylase SLT domain-containing protein [Gaiellaceae bacterium]